MPVNLIPQFNIDEIINQMRKDYAPLNHKHTGSDTPLIDISQIVLPAHGYLRSGQSAYNTGIGFYIGSDGVSFGNSAGDFLTIVDGNLSMSGTVTATAGEIGGWSINATSIYTGTEDHDGYTANAGDITIYSSGTDASIHAKNFYIDTAGNLTTDGGTITGGTIIGARVATGAEDTFRMEMRETGVDPNPDALVWMDTDNEVVAGLTCTVGGILSIVADDNLSLAAGAGDTIVINNVLGPTPTATHDLGAAGNKFRNLYLSNQLSVYGNSFLRNTHPTAGATYDLGQNASRWKDLYLSGDIAVTGSVDGVDVSVFATTYNTHLAASTHHSSTSNNLTITPTKVNIDDPAGTTAALNVDGDFHLYTGSIDIKNINASIAWNGASYLSATAANLVCEKYLVLETAGSDPTGVTGLIFFHTGTGHFRGYDGSNWRDIAFLDEI